VEDAREKSGVLAWFASNHVAANLLMILIIAAGLLTITTMKVEFFPEMSLDIITVTVPYLGASPSDVEEGVVLRVEEAIAAVDGIKRMTASAAEGAGMVFVEVEEYADVQEVLDDIKAEVDRIITFPEETEKPIITEVTTRYEVITIVLYGSVSEKTLKTLADGVRDDLTALQNISQVDVAGVRPYEISIEVSEKTLRRYGLSFDQVSRAVSQSSLDVPAGSVKTEGGEILLRTRGQKYYGHEFEKIIVFTRNDGTRIRLADIAEVKDDFEDVDLYSKFDGKRAALVKVFRVGEQGALDVADTVRKYVEEKRDSLPEGVSIATWQDSSVVLRSRIGLLRRNAYLGLLLVFICLTLFLNIRLAFWTTMGIPISFLGAFWLLPRFDVSLNMISLFAFIMALGLVVDDAIPIVVISVLMVSLVEALLILPAHLSARGFSSKLKIFELIDRIQLWTEKKLEAFVNGPFADFVIRTVKWRYVTLAVGCAIFIMTVGYILGGYIKVVFFDPVEADNMIAFLTMPRGTPAEQTREIADRIEKAVEQVRLEVDANRPDKPSIIKHVATTIGAQPASRGGGPVRDISTGSAGHLAEVNVELLGGEERNVSSTVLKNRWRDVVGEIPGVSTLTFFSEIFSAGEAINVELSHQNFDTLLLVVEKLKSILREYSGVSDITDSFEPGKAELKLELKDTGRTLGLTLSDLARQVRQGFYGQEAQRIQRGRDDIRVMVRYPQAERRSLSDIENTRIRLPDGTEIPFKTLAEVGYGRGYSTIRRAERRRVVNVTADVDVAVANAAEINKDLDKNVIPGLMREYPGLQYRFAGEARERSESFSSLYVTFPLAMMAIYGLLAVQFRSYTQPIIVMSAIPFGIVGAVIGHVLMGFVFMTKFNLGLLSMFGIVALSGVVVNDSLILIDLINRERKSGIELAQIVRDCATRRFRPIMLTTLTTFFGLVPMMLERSLQARFLIPMAISLAFGVMFATLITLFLVPSLYMILEDVKSQLIPGTQHPGPSGAG